MLEVSNLKASYNGIKVIWDISFKVYKGEIVTLIGPNGAGKTTILKCLMGLLPLEDGEIIFNGKRIDGLPTYKIVEEGMVMVPEGRRIFPLMSVKDNLLVAANSPKAKNNKEKNLEYVYDLFPVLKERANQLGRTLSGGEQQMLAIARALMACPSFLILDEPFLGLMPKIRATILAFIEKIRKEGLTILIAEQLVKEALGGSDRGYVIEKGKITMEGDSKSLLKNAYIKRAFLGF
jgi:branched-chain amino acid transport system ATP-binding protein